jgi:hypothetical protein
MITPRLSARCPLFPVLAEAYLRFRQAGVTAELHIYTGVGRSLLAPAKAAP